MCEDELTISGPKAQKMNSVRVLFPTSAFLLVPQVAFDLQFQSALSLSNIPDTGAKRLPPTSGSAGLGSRVFNIDHVSSHPL